MGGVCEDTKYSIVLDRAMFSTIQVIFGRFFSQENKKNI
jgi:hypothetical protein